MYTLRPQSINTAVGMRGNGGIRTHNENFCHELINYAVRIVYPHCILITSLHKVKLWEEFVTAEAIGVQQG